MEKEKKEKKETEKVDLGDGIFYPTAEIARKEFSKKAGN